MNIVKYNMNTRTLWVFLVIDFSSSGARTELNNANLVSAMILEFNAFGALEYEILNEARFN